MSGGNRLNLWMLVSRSMVASFMLVSSMVFLTKNASQAGTEQGRKLDPSAGIVGIYPEFEKCSALIFGFSELVRFHPKALVDIVVALNGTIPIAGIVADEFQRNAALSLLEQAGISSKNLDLLQVPVVGMWMRDYGPTFVRRQDGQFMVLDAQYAREGHEPDDWIPRYLAGYYRLPVVDVPIHMVGGNFLGNGEGLIFTTTRAVTDNEGLGIDKEEVAGVLYRLYGVTDWHIFKPLAGEPTGHIDMFMTLVAPDVAVVGGFDPKEDPVNARQLDELAAKLAQARTRSGSMKVIRITMPSHEDGMWRSYTNVVFANDTLLVPAYPDVSPELDKKALKIYSELLPDRRIVPIDSTTMIRKNGSLHCISVNVPELEQNR